MTICVADSRNPQYADVVYTHSLAAGGSGYVATEVLTLPGGNADATITVDSVDGSGGITAYSLTTCGSGYSVGTENCTGGSGAGAQIDVDSVASGLLSTPNGFWQAEAWNMGGFGGVLALSSSERLITVTFAHAGDCQGILLDLYTVQEATAATVTVELQENSGGWTTRATKTLTAAEISISSRTLTYAQHVPFLFATPYAVTVAGSTWRFRITSDTTNHWQLRTSDGTNAMYVTWCDNQCTFADNDAIVCVSKTIINQTATVRGVLGDGDTTRSVAAIVPRNSDATPASVCLLEWENPPKAAYTFTMDGLVLLSKNGGIRIGTAAAPIPYAQRATLITQQVPTYGSASNSGLSNPFHVASYLAYSQWGTNVIMYGEIPTIERTTLAADALTGQADIVTTDDCSAHWAAGDVLYIGKTETIDSATTPTTYTILSISGTTITLTGNLGVAKRLAGGPVVNMSAKYGVEWKSSTTTGLYQYIMACSNMVFSGVTVGKLTLALSGYMTQDAAYRSKHEIKHVLSGANCLWLITPADDDTEIEDVSGFLGNWEISYSAAYQTSGSLSFTRVWLPHQRGSYVNCPTFTPRLSFEDCFLGNANGNSGFVLSGASPVIKDCVFFSCNAGATQGYLRLQTVVGGLISGCTFDNCYGGSGGINFISGYRQQITITDCEFGQEVANAIDVQPNSDATFDVLIKSPTGALNVDTTYLANTVPGSLLRVQADDDTTNDDKGWTTLGKWQRCGDGLTDTTVHTTGSGKFSLRLEPLSSTNLLEYPVTGQPRSYPTGNISGKTMLVSVWVKINAAAFYAGTHEKPTLHVDYDDGTEVTAVAVASTSWQRLDVTFTPSTAHGEIEVWASCATDATSTEAYVYWDDWAINLPAGVQVDLQGIDNWAKGVPVWPPVTTFPTLGGVLDELLSLHTLAGSAGEALGQIDTIEKRVDDATILGLI
jgi:hypothetical protein